LPHPHPTPHPHRAMSYRAEELDLPGDLLTYREAWELLGKSRTTIRRMVEAGELEVIMVGGGGGRPRILRPSVTEYLRRQLASHSA
jgi:excisionase family DNA binding protein